MHKQLLEYLAFLLAGMFLGITVAWLGLLALSAG